MPLDIPLPTASPEDDPAQYIPLLLSAIEGFLLARDVWAEADYTDARQYMEQLMSYIVDLLGDDALARPIGNMQMWPAAAAPAKWLLCQGQSLLRATYPALFAVIGTVYGAADGTHFNLPDMRDRSPMMPGSGTVTALAQQAGALAVTLAITNLPAHDHDFADGGHNHAQQIGTLPQYIPAGGSGRTAAGVLATVSTTRVVTDTNGSNLTFHNQGGNTPHANLHPVLGVNFIIYAGVSDA